MKAILAIETCVPEASVALWVNGGCVFKQQFASDRNHNSMVFNAIENSLAELGELKLDLVIVGTGPGSYSGTRIGIAVGQGVALAHNCPAVGLGSFAATFFARQIAPSMAVGDARRGLYYISKINDVGEAAPVELMNHEEFEKKLISAGNITLFTFDDPASFQLSDALSQSVERVRPEAHYLIDTWQDLSPTRRDALIKLPLSPTYLRAPFTSKAKPGHPLLR